MPKSSFKLGKFQKCWTDLPEFKGWLRESENGEGFCRLCSTTLRPHVTDLKRHSVTKKHKDKVAASVSQNSVTNLFPKISNDLQLKKKKRELRLCVFASDRLLPVTLRMMWTMAQSYDCVCLQVTDFCLLHEDDVNYGTVFLHELGKSKLCAQTKSDLKLRARNFLIHLFVGLQKRLTGAFTLQSKIHQFSYEEFMEKRFKMGDFPAPFFPQAPALQAEIESQCQQVQNTHWKSSTTEEFWIEVNNCTDAVGNYPYRALSQGVLKILCLPVSNAEVERVFSQVNVVKDKKRNRMKTDLLESILFIKFGLRRLGQKAQHFIPPASICNYTSSIYT